MKRLDYLAIVVSIILLLVFYARKTESSCLTGAFLVSKPKKEDIIAFKNKYGKKPFLVMVFVDWNNFIDGKVIEDIYSQGCVIFVTWEPWNATKREGIDYDGLLSGKYDRYIRDFANKLKKIENKVFLRFAHEMNGNWYPWSGTAIGKNKYVAIYRYVKDTFNKMDVTNVEWVFSVNWEDVPKENNHFMLYYPGDVYVDYVGIDGYNWGDTQSWSKWMSFRDIFEERYNEISSKLRKPVMITEFSSTGGGGNKTQWIRESMDAIKQMEGVKAFVLFNADKEVDWSFPGNEASGKEFKKQLEAEYFKDYNFSSK